MTYRNHRPSSDRHHTRPHSTQIVAKAESGPAELGDVMCDVIMRYDIVRQVSPSYHAREKRFANTMTEDTRSTMHANINRRIIAREKPDTVT